VPPGSQQAAADLGLPRGSVVVEYNAVEGHPVFAAAFELVSVIPIPVSWNPAQRMHVYRKK
jgi:hypothetical protein